MNDRFKFRIFYKPEKEMIYDAQATYDNACKGQGSFHHWSFQEVLDDDDCIVMQCTGLKDKNGKLIYEGDIVNGSCGVYWGKMIVEYNVTRFVLNKKGKRLDFLEKDNFVEVIGNIYENKELLDEQ